ncbi:MAG: drug/metabolite transporter (DMT)-like permease [Planctomycetota bacterium]|jgi:drug/metabolite transporter (DMT)-like permease
MPPALRILVAGALFATGGALIKSCEFPSAQSAGIRALVAAITIFALMPEARVRPTRRVLVLIPAYFAATFFFVLANTMTTAASTIFLAATAPLWVMVLGPLVTGERAKRRDFVIFVGIAIGMTLCFLAPTDAIATAPNPVLGNALALCVGIGFALLLLGMRRFAREGEDVGAAVVAWGSLATGAFSLALMPVINQALVVGTANDWLVMAALGVFQVGLAYVLLTRALPHVPAVRASLILMIEPALNPVFAYAAHGEEPHAYTIFGGALIIGSVAAGSAIRRAR